MIKHIVMINFKSEMAPKERVETVKKMLTETLRKSR